MLSTSSKIACGYILLIALLLGAIVYIYRQMNLLIEPAGVEENINNPTRCNKPVWIRCVRCFTIKSRI